MSIRNISYYGWQNVFLYGQTDIINSAIFDCIFVDGLDNIYVGGRYYTRSAPTEANACVFKSSDEGNTWRQIDNFNRELGAGNDAITSIAVDLSGNVYAAGYEFVTAQGLSNWIVRKGKNNDFVYIDNINRNNGQDLAQAIIIDLTGNIYVAGIETPTFNSWAIRRSTTGESGSFQYIDSMNVSDCRSLSFDASGTIYAIGASASLTPEVYGLRRSTTGLSSSFSLVDGTPATTGRFVSVDRKTNNVYTAGTQTDDVEVAGVAIRKSLTGASGTFSYVDWITGSAVDGASNYSVSKILIDQNSNIYVIGDVTPADGKTLKDIYVRRSSTGNSGSFAFVDRFGITGSQCTATSAAVDSKNNIYIVGAADYTTNKGYGLVRKGRLSSNSASIGPRMLATSFGYVSGEITGSDTSLYSLEEQFNLNNISEFPHSSGLFQMPSMVLGTKSSGRAGKTDDAIVQKRFIGSFVRVMWPKQDDDSSVRGCDIGRKPGKLSTEWQWGDAVEVAEKNFDSLSLNCVVSKQVSGTLDSILVRIETKPLLDSGYFVDQTIEQTISSSYASEAIYRDHVHRKDIDFGDTSLSEISWKIEQDLTNVKSLRIACRQKNGQSDDKNKQFLIVGRFITKSKDHNET